MFGLCPDAGRVARAGGAAQGGPVGRPRSGRGGSERAFDFLGAVSSAFYAANRDVTQPEVLADIAAEAGMDRDRFAAELASAAARNETIGDFQATKQSGVEGFPLLAAGSDETGYALVAHGFRPLDGLPEAIETWLGEGAPVLPRV